MMETEIKLTVEDEPTKEDLDSFLNILRAFNRLKVGEPGYRKLYIMVRDKDNKVLGGLTGETYLEWLYIENLAVDERARHDGIGSKMLKAAEDEARKRRCHSAFADTYSFQALPFYQKHGYKVFGELKNFPQGHSKYFVYKKL